MAAGRASGGVTGEPGVINVTTGRGGVNALNGVLRRMDRLHSRARSLGGGLRETYVRTPESASLRQLGDQEADIIAMVRRHHQVRGDGQRPSRGVRYPPREGLASRPERPSRAGLARRSVDVQSSSVDEGLAARIWVPPAAAPLQCDDMREERVPSVLHKARPTRNGLSSWREDRRSPGGGRRCLQPKSSTSLVSRSPQAGAHDLIDSDDLVFCGRPGTIGTRPGNFAVQNSDVLLVLEAVSTCARRAMPSSPSLGQHSRSGWTLIWRSCLAPNRRARPSDRRRCRSIPERTLRPTRGHGMGSLREILQLALVV